MTPSGEIASSKHERIKKKKKKKSKRNGTNALKQPGWITEKSEATKSRRMQEQITEKSWGLSLELQSSVFSPILALHVTS